MRHLFNTSVEIYEATTDIVDGARVQTWQKSTSTFDTTMPAGELKCRLDLTFLRPGKDAPAPIVAGRTPDRTGIMFCSFSSNLQGGQLVKCISGPYTGLSFLIKMPPDAAQDYSGAHHIEVQVFEVNQAGINYPSGAPK